MIDLEQPSGILSSAALTKFAITATTRGTAEEPPESQRPKMNTNKASESASSTMLTILAARGEKTEKGHPKAIDGPCMVERLMSAGVGRKYSREERSALGLVELAVAGRR